MPGRVKRMLLILDVREAGRRCKCGHNAKHQILKGEIRLVIRDPGIATGEKGYCAECALKMIDRARADLDDLETALRGLA